MDEFLYSLQLGWEIPPGFPRDRFVPTGYGNRDLVAPIVQYLDDFGFTGDARRLHEATRRFYAHRDWQLKQMFPRPGDDKGWKEFQERYVKPLGHELAILQGRICDVRQLIIDAAAREVVSKLAATEESTNRSQALPEVGNASQGDEPSAGGPWSKPDGPTQWAKKYRCSQRTWVDTRIAIHPAEPKPGQIRVKKHSTRSYSVHVDDLPKEASDT